MNQQYIDVGNWSRKRLQSYLEGHGFAVYDEEPKHALIEAVRINMAEDEGYAGWEDDQ